MNDSEISFKNVTPAELEDAFSKAMTDFMGQLCTVTIMQIGYQQPDADKPKIKSLQFEFMGITMQINRKINVE